MATDADAPAAADDALASGAETGGTGADRPRIDRRVGESVDCTPEALYLTRIALLEARVEVLEGTVAQRERDLQTVVDRYERVLRGRDTYRGEPLVDRCAPARHQGPGRVDAHDERGRDDPDTPDDPDDPDGNASEPDRWSGVVGTAFDRLRSLL